jgi:subtilisin family serine protease
VPLWSGHVRRMACVFEIAGILKATMASTTISLRDARLLHTLVYLALIMYVGWGAVVPAQAQDARYIVRFRSSSATSEDSKSTWRNNAAHVLDELGLQNIDQIPHDNSVVVRLRLEDALLVSSRSEVRDLELDERIWAFRDTNDPLLGEQSSLSTVSGSGVISAWDITTGSQRALVAVIDSGADLQHPDLKGNIWRNPKEIAGNGRDDDQNGWVDDTYGYDFVNKDGVPYDDNGHGTHVAGIVAAVGNNSAGVAGVAWGSKIVVVKALDEVGSGYVSTIAKAIDYVTDLKRKGVPIVVMNLSLGGANWSRTLYRAVERARNHDILLVAAAGNEGANNDLTPLYPASFPLDSVISVAATGADGGLASFSNYGAGSVHLAAPGSAILSTALRKDGVDYRRLSGTSMASPHVSGVLALVAASNPHLTALQVRAVALNTTRPQPGLKEVTISGGAVDASSAVSTALNTTALPRVFGYVSALGKAATGAQVTLASLADPSSMRTATTGKDGSFSISEVAFGDYKLSIRMRGRRFRPTTVRASTPRIIRKNITAQR